MTHLPQNTDCAPVAPATPRNEDCCHSGCAPCIFDLYDEELERYRRDLKAWQERAADKRQQDVRSS